MARAANIEIGVVRASRVDLPVVCFLLGGEASVSSGSFLASARPAVKELAATELAVFAFKEISH